MNIKSETEKHTRKNYNAWEYNNGMHRVAR